ncbi:MAG: TonB-dependent receptor [Ferruginibacter sp.]
MKYTFSILFSLLLMKAAHAQTGGITGDLHAGSNVVASATVTVGGHTMLADSLGHFELHGIAPGKQRLSISATGYETWMRPVTIPADSTVHIRIEMISIEKSLEDVVITGTLKEVKRLESPVAVEVYTPAFFKKNPSPNIYDALQNVNGVRPQLNCQVCNTGDIHINGLEGPYTMVLLDGMPIVSALSTVYGLSGIPNSLVERMEIVKGPASSLYGSEAVGGLINIITKNAAAAPLFSADVFATGWGEVNADISARLQLNRKTSLLSGLNYFNFQNRTDRNKDGFTDVTLQDRLSLFEKISVQRKENRLFNIAARYMYEDRWGGDMRWNKNFRGGDSIYGESIYTNRWELLGQYQLPTAEKMMLSVSYNEHYQNSAYGTTLYNAVQKIAFSQLTWDKTLGRHAMLTGAALRYTFYDDNTPATAAATGSGSQPQRTWLPGVFVQDEIALQPGQTLLLGARYDHNNYHGSIFTPRMAYKRSINAHNIIRLNAGTGFRVVNLFTEDHAALTGARTVIIKNELKPEKSYNANINYIKKMHFADGSAFNIDASVFYTYFNNRIVGDFDSNPNQIIYDNLDGHAVSKGITLNMDMALRNSIKIITGATLMGNTLTQNGQTSQQILTEKFTGTWSVSYKIKRTGLSVDYTGNVYSPMRLPLLSEADPRKAFSPWWSIQNIQFTYAPAKQWEIYGGVKNLLQFLPGRGNPFLIARTQDPFDKDVQFDSNGQVIATSSNPYGLTFDPNYVYAPNQGRRGFIGLRYTVK